MKIYLGTIELRLQHFSKIATINQYRRSFHPIILIFYCHPTKERQRLFMIHINPMLNILLFRGCAYYVNVEALSQMVQNRNIGSKLTLMLIQNFISR